jgi:uncharacterized membrane-anchored protein
MATTLGETAGDALSTSLDLGYVVSSLIFLAIFVTSSVVIAGFLIVAIALSNARNSRPAR